MELPDFVSSVYPSLQVCLKEDIVSSIDLMATPLIINLLATLSFIFHEWDILMKLHDFVCSVYSSFRVFPQKYMMNGLYCCHESNKSSSWWSMWSCLSWIDHPDEAPGFCAFYRPDFPRFVLWISLLNHDKHNEVVWFHRLFRRSHQMILNDFFHRKENFVHSFWFFIFSLFDKKKEFVDFSVVMNFFLFSVRFSLFTNVCNRSRRILCYI